MSNPYCGKMKSTGAAKMAKTTGSAKNYESDRTKAARRYAEGGAVADPVSTYRIRKPTASQMDSIRSAATPPAVPTPSTQGSS